LLIFYITKHLYHGNFNQLEKYLGNAQARTLDVERVHQSHLKWFTSNCLAMAMQAFDFKVSLNMDCWISKDVVNRTLGTQVSLLTNFLGWQKAALIASICFLKLFSTLNYNNQYSGYITPKLSMIPWVGNLLCNFVTRKWTTPTNPSCHIQFNATKQILEFKLFNEQSWNKQNDKGIFYCCILPPLVWWL
jgi:hypothetical protein